MPNCADAIAEKAFVQWQISQIINNGPKPQSIFELNDSKASAESKYATCTENYNNTVRSLGFPVTTPTSAEFEASHGRPPTADQSTGTSIGPAPAPGAGDQPVVTTPARWVEKPSDDEIAAAFPDEARAADDSGHVVVQCEISAAGEPSACSIQSETPAGDGFGQAALSLAPTFKFKPKTVNGVAVDGGVATMSVRLDR